ncbi:MAG: methyltransferase [Polyangiales bacterium]
MTSEAEFVRAHTAVASPPMLPELRLHLATELSPLWEKTQDWLDEVGLPPPYWAFAWAGGQAVARFLLDTPDVVRGTSVLDFGAGSGMIAIAAARAGAKRVTANDVDAFALAAIPLNAALNEVAVTVVGDDLVGTAVDAQLLLAGDVCYEQPMAGRVGAWLRERARAGATVLLGDPGRSHLVPKEHLVELARYEVPTHADVEGRDVRTAGVWRVRG